MIWGWPIAIYLFLAGIGSGAFLTAGLADIFGGDRYRSVVRAGALIAGPIVAFSTIFLIYDLGIGKYEPWRLIRIVTNTGSVMSWGVVILSVFMLVAFIYASFEIEIKWPWDRLRRYHLSVMRHRSAIVKVGCALAVAVMVYTGLLIGVVSGIPLWNTSILPALFATSAVSTGLAAAVIGAELRPVKGRSLDENDLHPLNQLHALVVIIELVMVFTWLFIVANGSSGGSESVGMLVGGRFSLAFWLGVVLIGLINPLMILGYEIATRKPAIAFSSYISDTSILVGGFALRYLVVYAAVPIDLLDTV